MISWPSIALISSLNASKRSNAVSFSSFSLCNFHSTSLTLWSPSLYAATTFSYMLSPSPFICLSFLSHSLSSSSSLLRSMFSRTSICLTFASSSSSHFDLLFLNYCNLSHWFYKVSSCCCIFSMIFSQVAKDCWVNNSSYFMTCSLFSDSASCSHKHLLDVSYCLRLKISHSCFSLSKISFILMKFL